MPTRAMRDRRCEGVAHAQGRPGRAIAACPPEAAPVQSMPISTDFLLVLFGYRAAPVHAT